MINSIYARAYTEVLEILRHFPKEEYDKIPLEKIQFYIDNMDKNYNFTINPEIDLAEQNISEEANAIIITLFRDYYATEEQKVKIKKILYENQNKLEQEKRDKYNPDNLFKKSDKQDYKNTEIIENKTTLIEYKESFFTKFKKFIIKIFKIN